MKEYTLAKKIDKVIFKSMWGISILSGGSLLIVAILCTVDAFGAKFFSHSVPNGTEWVTFLNIPVVFFAMGFIQVERGHTVVDVFSDKFPKVVRKIIKIFGDVIGAAICIYFGICELTLTADKMSAGTKASSSADSFLVWPFALIVAIGFVTVAIAFIWCIFREFLIPENERQGAMVMPKPEGNEEDMKGGDKA